jgi:hemolysin III
MSGTPVAAYRVQFGWPACDNGSMAVRRAVAGGLLERDQASVGALGVVGYDGGEGLAAMRLRPALRGAMHRSAVPVAVCLAVLLAVRTPAGPARAAVIVYGICVITMLTVSGVYHLPSLFDRNRRLLRRFDHSTILLAIAGTYTGVVVLSMSGITEVLFLALAWAVAAAGIAVRMVWFDGPSALVGGVYIAAGWLALVHPGAFLRALDAGELALLVAGGLLYTAGAAVFALQRPNPWPSTFGYHEIFHACVVGAAFCHWLTIYLLAA